jgi:hypothetical protein
MPTLHDTASPRFKRTLTDKDLQEVSTPPPDEVGVAKRAPRIPATKVGLVVVLKTFHRLGYFPPVAQIARRGMAPSSAGLGLMGLPPDVDPYDAPATGSRPHPLIRDYGGVPAYGPVARRAARSAGLDAAQTKEDLAEIIKGRMEALVEQRFELPAFSTLARIAFTARRLVKQRYPHTSADRLGPAGRAKLDTLLLRPPAAAQRLGDQSKREPKSPTVTHLQEFLAHRQWVRTWDVPSSIFAELPAVKLQQFAAEARALPAYEMRGLGWSKRDARAAARLRRHVATALDELTQLLLRRMPTLPQHGEEALAAYRRPHQAQLDALLHVLDNVTPVGLQEKTQDTGGKAVGKLFSPAPPTSLAQCEAHHAYAGNNSFAFLPTS